MTQAFITTLFALGAGIGLALSLLSLALIVGNLIGG